MPDLPGVPRPLYGFRLWLAWTALSGLGYALGALVKPGLPGAAAISGRTAWFIALVVLGAAQGLLVGFLQAAVLRRSLLVPVFSPCSWILLTVLATALAYAVSGAVPAAGQSLLLRLAAAGLQAALFAALQWLELRRGLPGAAGWILPYAAAYLLWNLWAGLSGAPETTMSLLLLGFAVSTLTGGYLAFRLHD